MSKEAKGEEREGEDRGRGTQTLKLKYEQRKQAPTSFERLVRILHL